jgi:DNA (cytosine-5)-methyltransferase 1
MLRPTRAARTIDDIDQLAPTSCATDHINLVEATEDYDIQFRMLEVHELVAAMGLNDREEGRIYRFAGTKTDGVKQVGNAVSVRKVRAVVRAFTADALDEERDAA